MKAKKQRIFDIIQIGKEDDAASKAFDWFLVFAILLNITVLILETFPSLAAYEVLFRTVEIVTILFFIIEYALRIWTADLLYPDRSPARARLRFLWSFDGVVDLLTILPFFFLTGFGVFRVLRVARIFHLFRINPTTDSFQVIIDVLNDKRNALMSSIFIVLVLMLGASLCMYGAEHDAQPEAFQNAFSAIWWSVSTIFTVGYGDIYPVTLLGRIMAVVITFLGVGAVAIPTGIISAGFVEHYTRAANGVRVSEAKKSSVTVLVDADSFYCGRTVAEIEQTRGVCVTALVRGTTVLVPTDPTGVEAGDILIYMLL